MVGSGLRALETGEGAPSYCSTRAYCNKSARGGGRKPPPPGAWDELEEFLCEGNLFPSVKIPGEYSEDLHS